MARRSAIATRVLDRLRGDDAPLRARGVALMVDALLELRLDEVIDADAAVATLVAGTTGENAALWAERHGRASWDRNLARTEADPDATLADWIGPSGRERLETLVAALPRPQGQLAKDAIDPALVRELLAPVWQEVLTGFAKKLPIPSASGVADPSAPEAPPEPERRGLRSRLKKRVEQRAGAIVERSKSVLGGLGAEVERQVQAAAREFSQGASDTVKDAVKARLESDEGKRITAELRRQALAAILDTPAGDALPDLRAFPVDRALGLAGPIAEHNRTHARWRALVEDEIRAVIEIDGQRTLRRILEEVRLLERVTADLLEFGDGWARSTVETDAFAAWVSDLVAP